IPAMPCAPAPCAPGCCGDETGGASAIACCCAAPARPEPRSPAPLNTSERVGEGRLALPAWPSVGFAWGVRPPAARIVQRVAERAAPPTCADRLALICVRTT